MKEIKKITLPKSLDILFHKKHPWIYRNKFRELEKGLKEGDFLEIINFENNFTAYGIYSKTGLIAVRVFYFDKKNFKELVEMSILKREFLLKETNSIRLIHGENDFIPGITVDLHNEDLVIMYYSTSLKLVARYMSILLYSNIKNLLDIKISSIQLLSPNRIGFKEEQMKSKVLRGIVPEFTKIRMKNIHYSISTKTQKSGIYNDIRNLRRYIFQHSDYFKNKKVLNLFSSNGLLSKVLEEVKATQIISVEDSKKILAIHEYNSKVKSISLAEYTESDSKQILIRFDILKNIKECFERFSRFDTIIIDPPSLTNTEKDKPKAKLIYASLFENALDKLNSNGTLILCSCSNRIHEKDFEAIARLSLRKKNLRCKNLVKLRNEIDHPTHENFPEGEYFKVHIYHDIHSF